MLLSILQVSEAYVKVNKILEEFEKCLVDLRDYQWQSLDPTDSTTEDYSEEDCIRLERAYKKSLHAIEMTIDAVAVIIDLHNLTETNKTTGGMRTIQRVKKSRDFDGK